MFTSIEDITILFLNNPINCFVVQILDQLFSISLSLPRPAGSLISAEDIELSYGALSSLEDVIAILRNVSSLAT